MKPKRFFARALALALSLSVTVGAAFAAPWYLEDGDITVTAGDSSQSVSQGARQEIYTTGLNEPVITQRNPAVATENTVTITGGGTANVTVQNVNIQTDSGSGIDVQGTTAANITVEGTNSVITGDSNSSAIHVSEGDLNLDITEGSSLTAAHKKGSSYGAAIGSHAGEDMSGNITLSGKGSVDADNYSGAAIGSGSSSHMTGTITAGAGTVNAVSVMGAGIGSGMLGNVTGDIITGSGVVNAKSFNGAGIGSGVADYFYSDPEKRGGYMNGTITTGSGAVNASSTGGAALGSGLDGHMNGSITIGSGPVKGDSEAGAILGSGHGGQMNGTLDLSASSQLTGESILSRPIGSGQRGSVGPEGLLTVEAGARINGQVIDSLKTITDMDPGMPEDQIQVILPVSPAVPAPDPAPAAEQSFYWVTSGGNSLRCGKALNDGVLTLTVKAEDAVLHITAYGLMQLQAQGVKTVVFQTSALESRFGIEAVLNQGDLALAHADGKAELVLGGKPSDLLK